MKSFRTLCFLSLGVALATPVLASVDAAAHVPAHAPRTQVLAGQAEAFRAYVTTGEGASAFAKIKADFDRDYLHLPFPDEPQTYGDPAPRNRTSEKADIWRAAQDTTGLVSSVAEAAALLWLVTGEEKYLAKAKEFLLRSTEWSLDGSRWAEGPGPGGTDIYYNDEAHFRLWRKLPLVYDQIRDQLTEAERATLLANFRERGRESLDFIKRARTERVVYNSLAVRPASHPVRFMPMTGLTALALWDDLPETREWWEFAHRFYREQFPPYGGDQGGWAEGTAYWRGNLEHASLQDALLAIGDPLAYGTKFWRNTPYFPLYTVQPYPATTFGDLSNAGRFNLEPATAEFLIHLARVLDDGYLVSYASLLTDRRPSPAEAGLGQLNRLYPTSVEFLVRNFVASTRPVPAPRPLSELPPSRYFADIGWVVMHSALGQPDQDIHVTFKSSPYGSFSHSHADQNAFVLSAFGENLALASGYREWHNSPHHNGWTRLTKSKNAVLIDGLGQKPQDMAATGRIIRYETGPRHVLTTGDATAAYSLLQPAGQVRAVLRDLLFVDQRYLVIRDYVETADPSALSWLLHGEETIRWDNTRQGAFNRAGKAGLTTRLVTTPGVTLRGEVRNEFDVPVDPRYVGGHADFSNRRWGNQSHLTVTTANKARQHTVWAVLWPEPSTSPVNLDARLDGDTLVVRRPDGRTDRIALRHDGVDIR